VKRAEKRTTSVVVAVDPLHVAQFGESIRHFSHSRTVAPAYSASKSTQCRECRRFGHSAPLCNEEAQACPICTLLYHRSAHRCANQSCPNGGFEKSVVGCCNASPPLCINCGGQRGSFDGSCPIRRETLSALRPPRDQDIPDAPDVGPPQTTPQGPTVHPTVPATPARHGPRFPPASESSHPATVKLVRSGSAQCNLAAPLPRRNLFGAGSTLFRASTGADSSEPAPTDIHMDLQMSTSSAPTQTPSPSQSFHSPGCLNLSIVQHNCLGSSNDFQTLFSFLTSVDSSPHIVALQDIPLWSNCPPVFRNYKCFFPPATDSYKPQVATYVHERLLSVISILPLFFERGDLMAMKIHSPEGLFDTSQNLFRLYNAYSIPSGHTRSVSPVDLFPQHDFPTLVLGDLNIHHSASNPTRVLSKHDQFISSPYFDTASRQLLSLLNTRGAYTRFPFTSNHRPAVLDLSFANTALLRFFSSWNPSLPPTGSDHIPLTIILSTPHLKPPPKGLNWKYTDWNHLSPLLADLTLATPPALPTPHSLDLWFDDCLAKITHLITSNTRTKRPSSYSKPWWTTELTQLRRIHHHTSRLMRKNQTSPALVRVPRNTYFKAIQSAKRVHWSQFLANVDARSVWDARKIAAS